ncbi:hypothetical protein [Nocardiopsis coralliicola]
MAGDQSDRTPPAAASDITQAVRKDLVDHALHQIEEAADNARIEAEMRPSAETLPEGMSGRPLLDAIGEIYRPFDKSSLKLARSARELAENVGRADFYTELRSITDQHEQNTDGFYSALDAIIPPLAPGTGAGDAPRGSGVSKERPSDVLRNSPVKLRNPDPRRKPLASRSGVYQPVPNRPHHRKAAKPLG